MKIPKTMSPPNPLILTILLLTVLLPINPTLSKPIKALVTPITKLPSSSLFSLSLQTHPNRSFLLDLSSPIPWLRCPRPLPNRPILCGIPLCSSAQSSSPPCNSINPSSSSPRTFIPCICTATLLNPLNSSHPCTSSLLTYTNLSLPSTNGHNPLSLTTIPNLPFGCAPSSFLSSLPPSLSGLASLSRSPLSLPSQLSSSQFHLLKQFAICLPSSPSSPGVAFFGSGPFFLLPPPGRNVSQLLQFTPLLKPPHSNTSFGYFINVKKISINGIAVQFDSKTLAFDNRGRGGVELSTIAPYTALRSPIYRAFLRQYARATSGIPRAPKVAPFDLCLNTSQLGSTRTGLPVAQTDLQLVGGKNWTIFGANTFKQVTDDVACLAFVDAGRKAERAVVIGSFQIENNFLQFDLVKSRLGFSSLLFFFQTTCGNFNFTSGV